MMRVVGSNSAAQRAAGPKGPVYVVQQLSDASGLGRGATLQALVAYRVKDGKEEPVRGLLSKEYAKSRFAQIDWERNDPAVKPGDPYPFQGGTNPFRQLLAKWSVTGAPDSAARSGQQDRVANPADDAAFMEAFYAGTTTIQAADTSGWVVSISWIATSGSSIARLIQPSRWPCCTGSPGCTKIMIVSFLQERRANSIR